MDKENVLEDWNKQFSSVEKLTLDEVKELYKKIDKTDNEELKQNYYNKIILGTEYVVYNYLKNTKLYLFSSVDFDSEDIISTAYGAWIEKIKKGDLTKAVSFSNAIQNSTFNNSIEEMLGLDNFDISDIGITRGMFYEYGKIHSDNALGVLSDEELRSFFVKYYRSKQLDDNKTDIVKKVFGDSNISNGQIVRVASFFNKICDYLDSTIGESKISDTNLKKYIKLIMSNAIASDFTDNSSLIDKREIDSELIQGDIRKKLVDSFQAASLSDREEFVIRKRFGIDDGSLKTIDELSKTLGIARIRVRQIETKSLQKLRRPSCKNNLKGLL